METPSQARLFVGLGNPKENYILTRHNIGRDFIDHAQKSDRLLPSVLFKNLKSYMNESGPPIARIMQKEGIKPQELVVIVDDFMIPFGSLRLRPQGSSGGHNGLKSIIETLGTEEFARLRVGVGPVPLGQDPADYVLKKFSKAEQKKIPDLFNLIQGSVQIIVEKGYQKAMTDINKQHFAPRNDEGKHVQS